MMAADQADIPSMSNLLKVNAGYFVSEGVALKIIEQYPELEQIFNNAIKVKSGYYMSDNTTIQLANYVQDINDENAKLQALADRLNTALEEERVAVQLLISEKDNIIALQSEQIEDYKELYRNKDPDIFEKASWAVGGAGIAAVLILLSNM